MVPETAIYARTLGFGGVLLLTLAANCWGQIVTSLHPAGTYPGDWLQFRGDRKLSGRSRLVGNIASPIVASASTVGVNRKMLPTLSYSAAVVDINTSTFVGSNGQTITNQAANVAFHQLSTSDGLSYARFGFFFVRAVGDTKVFLQFRPSVDPNLAGVAGFTQDVAWVVDPVNQTVVMPDLSGLPLNLQHLLQGIAANLANIYTHATQVITATMNSGPVWTIADVTTLAGAVSDVIFQPSPILWKQFIGARQTSVAFQAGGGGTINLPAADSNVGALAANATWGIGPASYDLNHNGNPLSFSINYRTKIGNFVPGSAAVQEVVFDSAFDTCGNNASVCSAYGHLYQWQNGNWVEQWKTDAIPALFEANTIVGDFDHDGRLEVAVEPWYNMQVYDLLTGEPKTSARFTPNGAESGRGYGWLGAYDLNGDRTQELVALGDFQNMIAVMGWKNGQLVKLWDHLIEASVDVRQTTHVPGVFPVQDIDGDGKLEVVTSIYNETADGQWHIVARDGMTGNVLLDLPQRFLVGMADVDGDGATEMFTIATNGLLTPEYGQVDVLSFHGRTLKTLMELNGVGFATMQLQNLPLNINTWDQFTTLLAGPITQGGLPVFFTQQVTDASAGTITLTAWQWINGALAKIGTVTGPSLQVVATRPASSGSPGFLITAAARSDSAGSMIAIGMSGEVVESNLISAPLSSAVVGHLRQRDPPTVIVQDALEELIAFRPSSATGTGTVIWTHPGRGSSFGSPSSSYNGQYGFADPVLASLAGDGTLQTIAATRGPVGQARTVAIQPDGSDFWTRDLNRFPGAPPVWNEAGAILLLGGRLRYPDREEVLVATRRGAQGSEELNLLDGRTGQVVWNDRYGNTLGTSPNERAPGEGWMSIYDWNHDGLDELVNEMTDVFWVKDGKDKNLIDRSFNPSADGGSVFSNVWGFYGVPAVADFLNNGTDTILFGASTYLLGLMDANGKGIWNGAYQAGTPGYLQGIADLDGDGTLSLVSAGATAAGGKSALSVQRASTGEMLWSIALPGCGTFAAGDYPNNNAPTPVSVGDINGDGREEAVFACDSTLYVVAADLGNKSGRILWSLDLGTFLGTPTLADPEGDGRLQIIVVGSNGYVYGIGSPPATPSSPALGAPMIAAGGVVEGASFKPGSVAPGGWLTILGANLSDAVYQASKTPLPPLLGTTRVTVNGQHIRLDYVSPTQINAELPPDLPVGPATVAVTTNAGSSSSASFQIVPAAPGIFQDSNGHAVAQNQDHSTNGARSPAKAGSVVVVYFTGAGLVNGDRRTGIPAPLTTSMTVRLPGSATIGGKTATVQFMGLTPGAIALYQANLVVPNGLPPGDYPVALTVGGAVSNTPLLSIR